MNRQVQCLFALLLLTSVLAGCSGSDEPDLYVTTGQVLFQGAPLAGAQITFVPDKGPVALGTTDTEGKFDLRTGTSRGVVEGRCRVAVAISAAGATELQPTMTPEDMQKMAMEGKLDAALKKAKRSLIPEKYNRADSSGLEFTVSDKDENNFTIDIK